MADFHDFGHIFGTPRLDDAEGLVAFERSVRAPVTTSVRGQIARFSRDIVLADSVAKVRPGGLEVGRGNIMFWVRRDG